MMRSQTKIILEDREVIAPVTALEFDRTGSLYVGEGPYLKIYETLHGKLVTKERIFENQRVHSIKLYDSNFGTRVIASGGRTVSVLSCVLTDEFNREIQIVSEVSFSDWIWDTCFLQGMNEESGCTVAAITGHNAVWMWNFRANKKWKISQCEEQCILYCARFIGRTLENMWLACGTVFNEVLLWKVSDTQNSQDKVPVRTRLCGHDGVIFSVRYNQERELLCSVSDDRSIKVWKAVFMNNGRDVTVSSEPLLSLYGHKARVWDCLILKRHIVSIGEDSLCLLWNSDGEIIRSWKGHIGKSIWSLACGSDENMIATGGGDSAVRLWLVGNEIRNTREEQHVYSTIPFQHSINQPRREEIPRNICLLHDTSVLVMTDTGNLYRFLWYECEKESCASDKWNLIGHEPQYSSYSIMALSDCRTIVAFGNISGSIKVVSLSDPKWRPLEKKCYSDKVLSLKWLKTEQDNSFNLFSCGPEGLVIWWTVNCVKTSQSFSCDEKAKFRLPYCRQRWPNSVHLLVNSTVCTEQNASLVLLGDRRGSLHLFKTNAENEPVDPIQSLIGIHGRNGVTSICSNSGYIYTTGRDGYIRQYKFTCERLELLDKKKVYKGMEWIDRVYFTAGGEVVVLGFHTVDFIIWSMTRNEVLLRVLCGGGHRNWDLLYTPTDHHVVFTYLKQSTIHVHNWSEIKRQSPSVIQAYLHERFLLQSLYDAQKVDELQIFQNSFHGRETNCVCLLRVPERRGQENIFHLFATGSEDTTINIMIYNPSKINGQRLQKLFSCGGHISSVRCLSYVNVDCHKHLLFSGGSRASLKCWSLDLDGILGNEINDKSFEMDNTSLNSSCTLSAELRNLSHGSRRKKRFGNDEIEEFTCDIRFMSLSVFPVTDLVWMDASLPVVGVIAGCSDGHVRFYVFDYHQKTFTLIGQETWNERCVLCVGHFFHQASTPSRLVVYATDTAGYISFWDVTKLYVEHVLHQNKYVSDNVSKERPNSVNTNDGCVRGSEMESNFKLPEYFVDCVSNNPPKSNSMERPFYSHKIHQSGVNSVSLMARENNKFLLCSGGDDGAVTFASFQLQTVTNKLDVFSWTIISISDAHTSAATGVKLLEYDTAVSASVDQRLKLWKIDWDRQLTKLSTVALIDSLWLDVVDVKDIDVHRDRNGSYLVAASGVGLQVITAKVGAKNDT